MGVENPENRKSGENTALRTILDQKRTRRAFLGEAARVAGAVALGGAASSIGHQEQAAAQSTPSNESINTTIEPVNDMGAAESQDAGSSSASVESDQSAVGQIKPAATESAIEPQAIGSSNESAHPATAETMLAVGDNSNSGKTDHNSAIPYFWPAVKGLGTGLMAGALIDRILGSKRKGKRP